ncbi:folylpolyglutamate synthase [gut metagenome]|uniref:Folylpolyglutamate synthase n=1 Tax=gut metagenome TaxID=749906 RepID=J9GYL7_9ZZZZ
MQRSTSFLEHLLTSHFCTIQTAADLNLDTFSAHTHCICDSHLDSTTISNLTLNLASDTLTNDISIEVGLLHFEDIDLNILIRDFLQFFLKLIYFLATLTDDKTRTRSADSDRDELRSTFDYDTGNTGLCQTCIEILTDLAIFEDVIAKVLTTIPIRIPTTNNTQTVTDRIYFLSHILCFSFSTHEQSYVV